MNMKRLMIFGMLGLFIISMMGGVFASSHITGEEAARTVTGFIEGFFGTLLGPLFGDQEMLSRVFFAFLLGMIIFSIVSTMFAKSSDLIKWGISLAITSLALLGLPAGFLEIIRTQYGAMGATILTIIPFIIILAFSLKTDSVLIARLTWIFYSVYYLAMFLYEIVSQEVFWSARNTPYFIAFVAGLLIFFAMPAIRKVIFTGKLQGITETVTQKNRERAERLKLEMDRLKTSQE